MKKVLIPLIAVVLLGAGCANTPVSSSSATSATPVPGADPLSVREMEVVTDGQNEISRSELDSEDIVVGDSDTPTLTVGDGEEVVVEQTILRVNMKTGNFFFEPKTITATAGQQVEITFDENDGFHTIVIDEADFKASIKADGTASFVAPTKPGNYPIYCDVGSHRANGMEAMLVVR